MITCFSYGSRRACFEEGLFGASAFRFLQDAQDAARIGFYDPAVVCAERYDWGSVVESPFLTDDSLTVFHLKKQLAARDVRIAILKNYSADLINFLALMTRLHRALRTELDFSRDSISRGERVTRAFTDRVYTG